MNPESFTQNQLSRDSVAFRYGAASWAVAARQADGGGRKV